ncbi:ROK family protein [Streptomyces sp. NPDC093018]|uniref:ROK family protein n=1 Tax=Streptomyces sp. NPDC093018 TaxID=3155067 RepID=UPI003436D639
MLAEASVPIEGDTGTGPAVQRVVAAVAGAVGRAGAQGPHTVGIGAPGLIDPATGDLRDSAGLPAWHRSLSAALQERLPGARVTVENETNLAALAEQREGAARDRDTFVLLWLGHGTGAAVVLDGTLRRGASGGTGEIGFLPVPGTPTLPSATDCSGGFHTLAGAAAVVSLGAEHGLLTPATTDGPGAAEMVRGAVERVLAAGEPAGVGGSGEPAGTGRPEEESGAGEGPGGGDAVALAAGEPVGARGVAASAKSGGAVGRGSWPVEESRPVVEGASEGGARGEVSVPAELVAARGEAAEIERETGPGGAVGRGSWPVEESRRVVGGASEGGARAGSPVKGKPVAARGAFVREEPSAVGGSTDREPATAAGADERFLSALADRIAIGAASVVAVLDPGCVVLGGEIGHAGGDVLAGLVAQRLRRMSPLPTEVRAGALGGSAVLRGALLTARDRAQDTLWSDPSRSPVVS